jgi:hypothetical protein
VVAPPSKTMRGCRVDHSPAQAGEEKKINDIQVNKKKKMMKEGKKRKRCNKEDNRWRNGETEEVGSRKQYEAANKERIALALFYRRPGKHVDAERRKRIPKIT